MAQITKNIIIKSTYTVILLGIISWVILFIIPAYWQARGQVLPAFFVRKLFSFICHQIPERCFFFLGYPLAVCARCSGIYFGLSLGILLYPFSKRSYHPFALPSRSYLILSLLPTSIDFLFGRLHIWENTHFSRALTGTIAGFGLAFYIVPALTRLSLDLIEFIANKKKGAKSYGAK